MNRFEKNKTTSHKNGLSLFMNPDGVIPELDLEEEDY